MAFKITDACIACGACAAECPVGAITEGDGKFEIDPEMCVECGACAGTCPVGAPEQEYHAPLRENGSPFPRGQHFLTAKKKPEKASLLAAVKK